MSTISIPNIRVVKVADSFYETAKLLYDQRNDNTFSWNYPFSVNIALSIELYLKSYLSSPDLIIHSDSQDGTTFMQGFVKCNEFGHDLARLYSRIDRPIVSKLESEFSDNHLSEKFTTLHEALRQYSDLFVKARYPYEKSQITGLNLTEVYTLANFLKSSLTVIGEFTFTEENN